MKKEKSPVLVILTIFFLSLFIVLPPVFRKTIPKQEKKTTPTSKLTVVICNKLYANELYRVNSKSKYSSDGTVTNSITYTKVDASQITEQNQESTDTVSVVDEMIYFKSIPNLNIVDSDTSTTLTINQSDIENYPTETRLISYLNDTPKAQKSFYEELGYVCNIVET